MSYVYAVARLKAMENHLLDASFFTRLLDSSSLDEAMKALGETVYSQWITGADSTNFDKVIDDELLYTCNELRQFVPDQALLNIYRMPYDFNNVKVILKSLFMIRENSERRYDLLSPLGSISTEALTADIESEVYGGLPYGLNDVIPQCWALWDQTKNPQSVELLLDRQLFAAMLKTGEQLKMPFLTDWIRHKIDVENLRNAVRLQRLSADAGTAMSFMHKGGTLRPEDLTRLTSEPLESWGKTLSYSDVGRALDSVQDKTDMQTTLIEISKILDGYLLSVIEKAKYSTDAPENVILYLLRKDMEARNLRIAMVCVINNLNRELARRLLSYAK